MFRKQLIIYLSQNVMKRIIFSFYCCDYSPSVANSISILQKKIWRNCLRIIISTSRGVILSHQAIFIDYGWENHTSLCFASANCFYETLQVQRREWEQTLCRVFSEAFYIKTFILGTVSIHHLRISRSYFSLYFTIAPDSWIHFT